MSTWAANTYNWNTIPYAWDDQLFYPAASSLALSGQIPVSKHGHISYPSYVTLTMGGFVPTMDVSYAPSIGVGTLSISGSSPVFAKGVFTTIPQGTLTFDMIKWSGMSATWTAVTGNWNTYGRSPTVGQTRSYDPETGIFTITGRDLVVVRKDPSWKPTVWII
tara:strand:+ start:305 stop:793 length:489 start_codon:yes stop_codon:yes gene_type:complete